MEVDGINLAVGGGAVTAIAGVFGAWIKARFGKTSVSPVPLPVEKQKDFVTVQECNRKMCEHKAEIAELRSQMNRNQESLMQKLDAMDDKSEQRAKETFQRINPLAEKLGEQIGQVKLIKETFIQSVVGGKHK